MKSVNLIPADSRRGGGHQMGRTGGAVYVVLGFLCAALVLTVMYVLAGNTISDRKAKLATLQAQAAQAQGEASRLAPYSDFARLAAARTGTVRMIASTRFDWNRSFTDLSRVVPTNTSLQSLAASVVPGTAQTGGISMRNAIAAPAFEMSGCTKNQDAVARLMTRLRLMHGVTRVTLQDSVENSQSSAGTSVTSGSSGAQGCGGKTPTFHIVAFFTPVPGAGPSGPIGAGGTTTGAHPVVATPASAASATTTTTTTGSTK